MNSTLEIVTDARRPELRRLGPARCSDVRPGTVQLSCPKCKAIKVNVNVSAIVAANGLVTCSHCGHERTIKALKGLSPCGQANLGLDTERFK